VYNSVIAIVTSITHFSKVVPDAAPPQYVALVKDIGTGLRKLIDTARAVLSTLPLHTHAEVEMAEKVVSSNMQKLVSALRMAVQYAETTLDVESKRQMLVEAHVLAVECKNFLQAVDSARIRAGVAKFVSKSPKHVKYEPPASSSGGTTAGTIALQNSVQTSSSSVDSPSR